MAQIPTLVALAHLRWDWVFQRPQHLLSRLARTYHVLFVEEPVADPAARAPDWELRQVAPGVTVCRAHTAVAEPGFNATQNAVLGPMLADLWARLHVQDCVAWFYTPMALALLDRLPARAVVYDCMDELSAFKHAPPDIHQRERDLFRVADVVFTGGPSLYRAKQHLHANIHCFPSSVDAAHFGRARGAAAEPADQFGLPHPRLGFFGVIDERLDIGLVDTLARAHPDWQLIMVGPVAKIDPASLPRRPNTHYLGQRAYADLPGYLSGWDACLLPFARNGATRFISPTKTLEYMAAEKPIVSTPIRDVAEPYGDIVYLGQTPQQFVAACEAALAADQAERDRRTAGMRAVLARTSWDRTAAEMTQHIALVLARRQAARPAPAGQARPTHAEAPPGQRRARGAPAARHAAGEHHDTVIIGAGPTGLSAAYHAGPGALLIEQDGSVGGLCRSLEVNGFTFDYAGHIMFSNDPYVHELYARLLGDNVHWQDREAWIYSKNVFTRYPFQGALYGLPADVIKECIVGAIEARFGSLAKRPGGNGAGDKAGGAGHAAPGGAPAPARCHIGKVGDCCGDGVLESTARLVEPSRKKGNGDREGPQNFEEFIYQVWGAGIAKHFAIPYNRKLWAVPLTEMETSWLGGRVPLPDLEEMIEGALRPVPRPMGPNARFGYPLRGGFQSLMDGFLPHIRGRLRLNAPVLAVSPLRRTVEVAGYGEIGFDHLISTMPLPLLIRSMGDEAPPHVRQAAAGLRYVSVRCVHIGVGRPNLTEKHWIYYPEDTVFHRIFVQGNASPHCNPPGGFGLTCEITYSHSKPLPCDGDALLQRCIDDCRRVGIIGADDPIWAGAQCDLPFAYVVYDHQRARNVKIVRDWLAGQNIILAGRYSEWEYYNSDHTFIAGRKAVETVRARQPAAAQPAAAQAAAQQAMAQQAVAQPAVRKTTPIALLAAPLHAPTRAQPARGAR